MVPRLIRPCSTTFLYLEGGNIMNLYEDLQWRGLIKDVAGEDLKDKLNGEQITF